MILIVGILWTCNIVLAIMPPADQLSGAESYVAGARARGEPISLEMQQVLQRSREAVYPLQLQALGIIGLSAAGWFLLHSLKNREMRRTGNSRVR